VRFVDRAGLFPTEQDILDGKAEFTCRCGWIDWNHVDKSNIIAYEILDDLSYIEDNFGPDPALLDNWAIYVAIPLGRGGFEIDFFNGRAVVPFAQLSSSDSRRNVTVSIFMDANEWFEELQGAVGSVFGIDRLQSSYYSEEDLPSDIIGLYAGLQRLTMHTESNVIYARVRQMCGAVGKQASLNVYRDPDAYAEGTRAVTGWRNWHARRWVLTGCNSNLCAMSPSRAWPSEFSALASSRIYPEVGGAWWRYRGLYEDGGLVSTERTRIFALQEIHPPGGYEDDF
jgi:hypothetical protein